MSTKIYTAWKFPLTKLEKFTKRLHDHQQMKALELFRTIPGRVKMDLVQGIYDSGDWKSKMTYEQFCTEREQPIRVRFALRACHLAAIATTRDPLHDVSCSFNLYVLDDNGYVIPFGEHGMVDQFKVPKWAEDYGYWNNSDAPDGVTEKAFAKRGKIWDQLTDTNHYYTHHSVDLTQDIGSYFLADSYLAPGKYEYATLGYKDGPNEISDILD
jgi:hypothetical protein